MLVLKAKFYFFYTDMIVWERKIESVVLLRKSNLANSTKPLVVNSLHFSFGNVQIKIREADLIQLNHSGIEAFRGIKNFDFK